MKSDLLTLKLQKDPLSGKDRISKMILKSSSVLKYKVCYTLIECSQLSLKYLNADCTILSFLLTFSEYRYTQSYRAFTLSDYTFNSNTIVVGLIASDLLDVVKGTYTPARTEWQNVSSSNVLCGIQKSLPPILIEIQLIINEACQSILQLYKACSLVLVFCTDKLSPSILIVKFKPVDTKSWMCEEPDASILPLLDLTTFLLEQSPPLYGHSHPHHPTTQMLYRLAKECVEVEGEKEQSFMDIVDVICSNNERLLHKVEDSLADVSGIIRRISTFISKKIIHSLTEYNQYIFVRKPKSSFFARD